MKLMSQFVDSLSRGFGHYGRWLYHNQKRFSLGVAIVFVVLTLGLVLVEAEDDTEYLFTPRGSRASSDRSEFRKRFGRDETHFGELAFVGQGEDQNLWKRNRLEPILKLHSNILEIQTNEGKKYEELCDRDLHGECSTLSILRCFGFSLADSGSQLPQVSYPTCFSPTNVSQRLDPLTSHVKTTDSSLVDFVKALKIFYTVEDTDEGADWELEFLKFMDDAGEKFNRENNGEAKVVYNSEQSLDRALEDGQQTDTVLVVVSFVLISIFAQIANMNWGNKNTPHTVQPAEASVWLALICVAPAWGIMSYAGVPFIAMNGVILFLTVGIGVDDMFIIVSSFNRQSRELSTEERIARTLEETGVAITITTATDILAFSLGLMSPFRSIQIFCAYMSVSLLWDYILHLTWFLVVLAYDAERDRGDSKFTLKLKSCLKRFRLRCNNRNLERETAQDNNSTEDSGRNTPTQDSIHTTGSNQVIEFLFSLSSQDYVGRQQDIWVAKTSNLLLNKKFFYVLLALGYSAYLASSVYGITNLEQGLRLAQLAPDDSHMIDYDDVNIDYFLNQNGFEVEIIVEGATQFHLKQRRENFQQLQNHILEESSLIVSKENTWVEEFEQWLDEQRAAGKGINGNMSESEFRQLLGNMLESSSRGREFRNDISFVDTQGNLYDPESFIGPVEALKNDSNVFIQGSKMAVRSKPLNDSNSEQVNMMDQSREATSAFDKITIEESTVTILRTAVVAMFAVAFVLLPSFIAQFIVIFGLASIFVGVLGFMSNWGLPLNSVTMVNLLISIGFSIDFTAHMCHAFIHAVGFREILDREANSSLESDQKDNKFGIKEGIKEAVGQSQQYNGTKARFVGGPTRRLRASQSLTTMGRPLLNGGISTILGILALVGGSSFIFRSFFQILLLVLLFGLLHGIVIIPVSLRLIGPALPTERSTGRQADVEVEKDSSASSYAESKLSVNKAIA